MIKENKICFKCKKYINDKDNYYAFTEYSNEKIVKIDYAHKKCWEDFLLKIGDVTEAKGMLRGLKTSLTTMGVLPEEVIQIT